MGWVDGEKGSWTNLLIRGGVESPIHRSNAANQASTNDDPGVQGHEAVCQSIGVHGAGSNSDHTESKASVHESLVKEATLVSGHSAVLPRLTVEDHVGSQDGTTNDGTTVHQLLADITLSSVVGLLHVCAAKSILEGLAGLGEDGRRSCGRLRHLGSLEGRVVDEAGSVRGLRSLAQRRRYGERAPKEEGHVDDDVCRVLEGKSGLGFINIVR